MQPLSCSVTACCADRSARAPLQHRLVRSDLRAQSLLQVKDWPPLATGLAFVSIITMMLPATSSPRRSASAGAVLLAGRGLAWPEQGLTMKGRADRPRMGARDVEVRGAGRLAAYAVKRAFVTLQILRAGSAAPRIGAMDRPAIQNRTGKSGCIVTVVPRDDEG